MNIYRLIQCVFLLIVVFGMFVSVDTIFGRIPKASTVEVGELEVHVAVGVLEAEVGSVGIANLIMVVSCN